MILRKIKLNFNVLITHINFLKLFQLLINCPNNQLIKQHQFF